jgi:cell division protein ZapB
MQNELKTLEIKLAQLVQLHARTRAENLQLRQDLAHALSQVRQSDDKIGAATARLEKILTTLPGTAT